MDNPAPMDVSEQPMEQHFHVGLRIKKNFPFHIGSADCLSWVIHKLKIQYQDMRNEYPSRRAFG